MSNKKLPLPTEVRNQIATEVKEARAKEKTNRKLEVNCLKTKKRLDDVLFSKDLKRAYSDEHYYDDLLNS